MKKGDFDLYHLTIASSGELVTNKVYPTDKDSINLAEIVDRVEQLAATQLLKLGGHLC